MADRFCRSEDVEKAIPELLRRVVALGCVQEKLEELACVVGKLGPEYGWLAARLIEDAQMVEMSTCIEEAAMPMPLTYEDFLAEMQP